MDKKTQRPPFLKEKNLTFRQWKEQKRREWKDVEAAMSDFSFGCYYTPNYDDVVEIRRLIGRVREGMTQKKWGR